MGINTASNLDIIFALCGGLLMCIATSLNLWSKGRITGNSGYLASLLKVEKESIHFRLAFIFGIWAVSTTLFLIFGYSKIDNQSWFFDRPEVMVQGLSLTGFGIAGFLVGFGTVLGNGCTSGHGVCGLPRFSLRSYVAVFCFMALGCAIGTFKYYVPFLDSTEAVSAVTSINVTITTAIFLGIALFGTFILFFTFRSQYQTQDILITFIVAIIFGGGLVISGMCRRTKILGFLALSKSWDPSLIFVMMSAAGLNFITFYYIMQVQKKPQYADKFQFNTDRKSPVTLQLIIGECLFGIGWGLGGLCPGPVIALLPFLSFHISAVYFITLCIGIYLAKYVDSLLQYKSSIEKTPLIQKQQ